MCTFRRLQTGMGGNNMMRGVVKGHPCHVEHLQGGPHAGFTLSNWGVHQFLGFPQEVFCLFPTSGKGAKNRRMESMWRNRRGVKSGGPEGD